MSLLPAPLRPLLALWAALAAVALPAHASCPPECPPYPAAYELTDLGTLGGTTSQGFGINDAGQVVGRSSLAGDAVTHAFLYDHGTLTDLGTLGGTWSSANAINAAGLIVGDSKLRDDSLHATLWSGGTPSDLGTNGAGASSAAAINTAGQIAGYVFDGLTLTSSRATVWDGASIVTLPLDVAHGDIASAADGISDAGQIVGWANSSSFPDGPYPALWSSSADLYTLLDSAGQPGEAIASTGSLSVGTALENPRPALWNGTTLTYLGGVSVGSAYALNRGGAVVGMDFQRTAATLWLPQDYGGASANIDLNLTLRPEVAATVQLREARGINSAGLIVANGFLGDGATMHAFLLTPAPAPAGPPAVQLSVSPATVSTGSTSTVNWSSSNAWSCLAGGTAPSWSGMQATSGSLMLDAGASPATMTLTLTCYYGNQGAAAQALVTVNYPQVSVSLASSASSIASGQSTTLTWSSQDATSCSASGGASGDGWNGAQPLASSKVVTESNAGTAAITLTYTLTCVSSVSNMSGAASATVTVMPQPSGGGGGALELWTLLLLAAALHLKAMARASGARRGTAAGPGCER